MKTYENIKHVAFILKFSSFSGSTICCGPWLLTQSFPIPNYLWPLPACCLFPLYLFPTSSHHLLHGLPLFLIPSLAAVAVCLSFPCSILFISLFVSVIQHSPLTGPYILMTIYLSDILSTFIAAVVIQVSVM